MPGTCYDRSFLPDMPAARTFSSFLSLSFFLSFILSCFLSILLLLLHRAVALSLLPLIMLARSSTIARQREMTPPDWRLR